MVTHAVSPAWGRTIGLDVCHWTLERCSVAFPLNPTLPLHPSGICLNSSLLQRQENERHHLTATYSVCDVLSLFRQSQISTHIFFFTHLEEFWHLSQGKADSGRFTLYLIFKKDLRFCLLLEICLFHFLLIKYLSLLSFSLFGFWQSIHCNCCPCSSVK